jgi:tellurite resistance protein TehA-like permease
VRELPPNIFAAVMATGVVALACRGAGPGDAWQWTAMALFGVAAVLYAILWALLLLRCLRHAGAVKDDIHSHARAPGFFTLVAATGVLGNGAVLIGDSPGAGLALWVAALVLWAGLTYTILPGLMEAETKPPVEKGLNGGWLLAVVATQAVSGLGSLVAAELGEEARPAALFAALCFWLVGGTLYIWLMTLIFYRLLFLPLPASDLTPPYWISMGAMAISTLAGVFLLRQTGAHPVLAALRPFLVGAVLLFWATATWWVPLLLALGAWRHLGQRFPLRYDVGYWAVVFPLGMYTTCTQNLIAELHLSFLAVLPAVTVWVALGAWALTFVGMLASAAAAARGTGSP